MYCTLGTCMCYISTNGKTDLMVDDIEGQDESTIDMTEGSVTKQICRRNLKFVDEI